MQQNEPIPVSLAIRMTEAKPATDEQIGGIKANFAGFSNCVMTDAHSGSQIEADEVLSLIARIEADRAEIAAKDAEIARLKAEAERVTEIAFRATRCGQCGGTGRQANVVSMCYHCTGTGRAR